MARTPRPTSANDWKAKVELSGPLFEGDVEKKVKRNIREMLEAVVAEQQDVLQDKAPRLTGDFAEGIVGRVRSLAGKEWTYSGVVSATHIYPWGQHVGATISRREFVPGGGVTRAHRRGANRAQAEYRGGKVEAKYHIFRTVARQTRRAIKAADLAKDLN